MSLKLTGEDHLDHVLKCSVAVVVSLGCCLIIGVTVLMKKMIDNDVEV